MSKDRPIPNCPTPAGSIPRDRVPSAGSIADNRRPPPVSIPGCMTSAGSIPGNRVPSHGLIADDRTPPPASVPARTPPPGSILGEHGPPPAARITVPATPSLDDFATIFRALDAFNAPEVGHALFLPLAVLLHDDAGAVIGGLWGVTVYSWLAINMLFVPAPLRRRGLGSALVRAAEAEARGRQCVGMQVDTFGFQAQPFYERLGFTVFGVQSNFPPGHRCVYLRKPFDGA